MASAGSDMPSKEQPEGSPAADLLRLTADPGSLSSVVISRKVSETLETPQAEAARLGKDKTILHFSLGFIVLIFALCAYTGFFNQNATESDKKWSFAVIGAFTGPVIGYVFKAIS